MVNLTQGQKEALKLISNWLKTDDKEFVLGGLAGTGKTFLLAEIAKIFKDKYPSVFIAPTGKAASNLNLKGVTAFSIHRVIYTLKDNSHDKLDFTLNTALNLPYEPYLIIVDEASMVSEDIYTDLKSFNLKIFFAVILTSSRP